MTSRTRAHLLLAVLILFVGALIRVHPMAGWMAFPDKAQHEGAPVLTNFDGYYYLSLTRDLLEGTYEQPHRERRYPDSPPRPRVPPLLCQLTALATKITGAKLDWVAAAMPCALGLLAALPLYGLGWMLGGPLAAHTAAALALFSPLYVARSSAGWFDTDPLNVFFVYAFALCAAWLYRAEPGRAERAMGTSLLGLAIFLLWWDQAPYAVLGFWAAPLVTAYTLRVLRKDRDGRERLRLSALFLLGLGYWVAYVSLFSVLEHGVLATTVDVVHYVTKGEPSAYPNVSISIGEQQIPGWDKIFWALGGDWPVVVVGAAGCVLLLVTRFREALFLAVPAGLLLLGCFKAYRFLVFAGPLVALGCGYAAAWAWNRTTQRWVRGLVFLLCLGLFLQSATKIYEYQDDRYPVVPSKVVAGMERLQELTPPDAVIWNWADHGYPLLYWSRRATVADGATHRGTDMVWDAIPFAADDPRLSANYIRFFATRGRKGMAELRRKAGGEEGAEIFLAKKLLSQPPEEVGERILELADEKIRDRIRLDTWKELLYPPDAPPVYLWLDWKMVRTAYWWYWFGTWNPRERKGVHPATRAYFDVIKRGDTLTAEDFRADLVEGVAWVKGEERPLKFVRTFLEDGREERTYDRESDYGLFYYPRAALALFLSENLANSLFHRVFWDKEPEPLPGFRLVGSNPPYYQVWEVIGDRWGPDQRERGNHPAE